jgi:glycosyltransferase involved in cell wall biosynthesis
MMRTVVHFIESAEFGGNEQTLLQIFACLDRRRWHPVLFHHPEPGLQPLLEEARRLDVKLRPVPRMQGWQAPVRMRQFFRELRRERPAVFHAHLNWPMACKFGLISATVARIPAVVATAQLFVEYQFPLKALVFVLQRFIARGVDRYIAVSHHVAGRLCQTYGLSAPQVCVVHNSVFPAPFSRRLNAELRAKLMGTTERPIVLTLARLDRQKGHCYLLEAAALVPEAVFVLAGEGPERPALEAQAKALGLDDRVMFLGFRDDVCDLLASCDLFVLPSLFEGLPLSVLEAMAAGKPVVATAIGGTDEAVVRGETGLLVPPAAPSALAEAIRTILSDPVLSRRFGTAGRARVQQAFSAETMVRRITAIYDELLDLPNPPAVYHLHKL